MQHSVKLPRDVLKLRCNGLFFCTCLVFCRDALCGGSNISSSVAGLAVSACGNGLSERLAAPIWVACVGMKIIWNANEALFCFLRTRRKILWKLLHFFPFGNFACGYMWNWMVGVIRVTADLLTSDSVSLIKSWSVCVCVGPEDGGPMEKAESRRLAAHLRGSSLGLRHGHSWPLH